MPDKQFFNPDGLYLIECKIKQEQIDSPKGFRMDKGIEYQFKNTIHLGIKLADKLVKADYMVELRTNPKRKAIKEANADFHLSYIFQHQHLEKFIVTDPDGNVVLDTELADMLTAVTYSTSRGILLTRLQGTAFQNFILPVGNPLQFLK